MKLISQMIIAFFALSIITSCAHMKDHSNKVTFQEKSFNKNFQYRSYKGKVFMSGQPTASNLKELKEKEGVTVVINLRNKTEFKKLSYNPNNDAEKLGLKYYNLPFFNNKEITQENINAIEAVFMTHHKKGEKVLVNCSSGNRVGAWFAAHVKTTHKDNNVNKLMTLAKGAGLKSTGLENKLEAYLKK